MDEQNKVIIYTASDGQTKIDVKLEDETLWLTQAQMCELYQTSKSNISEQSGTFLKKVNCRKIQLFGNSEQLPPMGNRI